MLLEGRLVRIQFPPQDGPTPHNSDFRLHVPSQKNPRREIFTSGYELGMSEQISDPCYRLKRKKRLDLCVPGLVTARPILYYSQNIHHLCTIRSDQQHRGFHFDFNFTTVSIYIW
jgi:hypothetical protein